MQHSGGWARRALTRFLAQQYCHSGWVERLGQGAYRLAGDSPNWMGAVYALQSQPRYQLALPIRLGAHEGYHEDDESLP